MKFTVNASVFRNNLALAAAAVKSSTIPVLNNLLLELSDNGFMEITGSCLTQTIKVTMDITGEFETGKITVPTKKILNLLGSMKTTDTITCETDGEKFNISTQTGHFMLMGLSPEDYPDSVGMQIVKKCANIKQTDLFRLITDVRKSIALDDSRKVLRGIHFEISDSVVSAATDGKRLSVSELDQKCLGDKCVFTVPGDVFVSVLKLQGEEIAIDVNDEKVCFSSNRVHVYSKLIEGTYPAFRNVVPGALQRSVKLNSGKMVQILGLLELIVKDQYVSLKVQPDKIDFAVSSVSGETGSDSMPVESQNVSEPYELRFNPRYLLDALEGSETAILFFSDGMQPVKIERDNGSFTVVMPLRKA